MCREIVEESPEQAELFTAFFMDVYCFPNIVTSKEQGTRFFIFRMVHSKHDSSDEGKLRAMLRTNTLQVLGRKLVELENFEKR